MIMLLALVGVFTEAAPFQGNIGQREISEMIIPAIQSAQAPLKHMLDVEEAEKDQMKDISLVEERFGGANPDQAEIVTEANHIKLDTRKAIKDEDTQQHDAQKSLSQLERVINDIEEDNKHSMPELGESAQSTNSIDNALSKLRSVSAELNRDTATSNTRTEIANMQHEADDLGIMALGSSFEGGKGMAVQGGKGSAPPVELGESYDVPRALGEAPATSGSMAELQREWHTAQEAKAGGKGLQEAGGNGPAPIPYGQSLKMGAEETIVQHLRHEEMDVEKKESVDKFVVHSLLQKLH